MLQDTLALYPLFTEHRIVEPIWGGTRLATWLHLPEPRCQSLGETWQVYDTNIIRNGVLQGHTLASVTSAYGVALVGARTMERYGADFPLLAKFIDANDRLSIQVHPNDAYAHTQEATTGFHGKTEAWYILEAVPGADIIYGLTHPSNRAEFSTAVQYKTLEPLLRRVPVQAGDVIFVPAGTIHAINAGIMLFEIQQKSDLTYRVYDYGRRDAQTGKLRELHLEKALDVIDYTPCQRGTLTPLSFSADGARMLLVACPYFALERWQITTMYAATTDPGSFEILTVIAGSGRLAWGEGMQFGGNVALRRGDSLVLPATLGAYILQPETTDYGTAPLQILRAYVPDLDKDLIMPLRMAGIANERIAEIVIRE